MRNVIGLECMKAEVLSLKFVIKYKNAAGCLHVRSISLSYLVLWYAALVDPWTSLIISFLRTVLLSFSESHLIFWSYDPSRKQFSRRYQRKSDWLGNEGTGTWWKLVKSREEAGLDGYAYRVGRSKLDSSLTECLEVRWYNRWTIVHLQHLFLESLGDLVFGTVAFCLGWWCRNTTLKKINVFVIHRKKLNWFLQFSPFPRHQATLHKE